MSDVRSREKIGWHLWQYFTVRSKEFQSREWYFKAKKQVAVLAVRWKFYGY